MMVINTLPTMMASQQLIEEAEQEYKEYKYNTYEKSRTGIDDEEAEPKGE